MQIRRSPSSFGAEPFSQHPHDRIKLLAFKISIRIRTTNCAEEIVFAPLLRSNGCDNLLRKNVERFFGNLQTIELTTSHRIHNRRTLNQLIARERKDS